MLKAEFGIEKESLRVSRDGFLASTEHLHLSHGQISRDFGESQVEFISRVYPQLADACMEICSLQRVVEQAIFSRPSGSEYMWTYSNPPLFFGEESIQIAEFTGRSREKTAYREYLAKKYGKIKMLFSGVHFNYSVPHEFFALLHRKFPEQDFARLKSGWYLKLSDALMSDSWLITALTAASPAADPGFLKGIGVPEEEWEAYATLRNSKYGYWNLFLPELSYESFDSYLESIDGYVRRGSIRSIHELYYPIRLKPKGENTFQNLHQFGANHMELRMLDLNPMSCAGVEKRDLIFLHLLIAYRMAELLQNPERQKQSGETDGGRILLHQEAAKLSFWETNAKCRESACLLLDKMQDFYEAYEQEVGVFLPKDYAISDVLAFEKRKISEPGQRYANRLLDKYRKDYIGARMREILGD